MENFISFFLKKIGKWKRHIASCNFWEICFFCKTGKFKTPCLPSLKPFWPRGGSATGIHGSREMLYGNGCISVVDNRLPCNNFHIVNQVTHQSLFKKPRKICWLWWDLAWKNYVFAFKLVFLYLVQLWYWLLVQFFLLVVEFMVFQCVQKMKMRGDSSHS